MPHFPIDADKRLAVDARVTIAYRDIPASSAAVPGDGLPILFIHAWPLSGATYRRLVSHLGAWRCIVPDSPGLGASLVPKKTPLGARSQAQYFRGFVDALGVDRFHLVAHDTGAMSARVLAAELGERVKNLVLFDTEIPFERPKGFGFASKLIKLPGARAIYRRMLRWPRFLWSDVGLGAGYRDDEAFRDELMTLFVRPLLEDDARFAGAMDYGADVSWELCDELAKIHPTISARVKLIWGEDDPLFLLSGARTMVPQFKRCEGLEVIKGGRLCAYDEFAPEVAAIVAAFLNG